MWNTVWVLHTDHFGDLAAMVVKCTARPRTITCITRQGELSYMANRRVRV